MSVRFVTLLALMLGALAAPISSLSPSTAPSATASNATLSMTYNPCTDAHPSSSASAVSQAPVFTAAAHHHLSDDDFFDHLVGALSASGSASALPSVSTQASSATGSAPAFTAAAHHHLSDDDFFDHLVGALSASGSASNIPSASASAILSASASSIPSASAQASSAVFTAAAHHHLVDDDFFDHFVGALTVSSLVPVATVTIVVDPSSLAAAFLPALPTASTTSLPAAGTTLLPTSLAAGSSLPTATKSMPVAAASVTAA